MITLKTNLNIEEAEKILDENTIDKSIDSLEDEFKSDSKTNIAENQNSNKLFFGQVYGSDDAKKYLAALQEYFGEPDYSYEDFKYITCRKDLDRALAEYKRKNIQENIYTGKPDKKKTKKQFDRELPWTAHLGDPAKGVADFNHMNTPTIAADGTVGAVGLGEAKLEEGTWSLPNTKEKALELVDLLNSPLYVEDIDKLYHLIGDDELFDEIDVLKNQHFKGMINENVKAKIAEFIDNYVKDPQSFRDKWDEDSLKILKEYCKDYF